MPVSVLDSVGQRRQKVREGDADRVQRHRSDWKRRVGDDTERAMPPVQVLRVVGCGVYPVMRMEAQLPVGMDHLHGG